MKATKLARALVVAAVACGSIVGTTPGVAATANARPDHAAKASTRITGRIVDRAGHALAGVVVTAESDISFFSRSARTDRTGRYSVASSPGAQHLTFDGARATGGDSDATGYFGSRRASVITRFGHVKRGIDLTMAPAAAIRGRVTDPAGHPLSGVAARLEAIQPYVYDYYPDTFPEAIPGTSQPTSRNGVFRVTGAATGVYRLCFTTDGHVVQGGADDTIGYASRCASRSVVVTAGDVTVAPATALTANGAEAMITGTVRGYNHKPLGGVAVNAREGSYGYSTTTDAHGTYRIADLAAHTYRVCFDTQGVRSATKVGFAPSCHKRVSVSGHGVVRVNATLRRGAGFGGTVRGANGAPLGGVPIMAMYGQHGLTYDAETNAAGRYRFKNLQATKFFVCFDADISGAVGRGNPTGGVGACADNDVRTKRGHFTAGVSTTLKPAGGISGTVRDQHGHPLRNVEVDLDGNTELGNEGEFYAYTDALGRYTAIDLPPVKFEVCFTNVTFWERCYKHTDWRHAKAIKVRPGVITRHIDEVLTVQPHGTQFNSLAVVARDAAGQPLAGVDAVLLAKCPSSDSDCLVQPAAGPQQRLVSESDVTDASGQVTWRGVEPGKYAVCLFGYYGSTLAGAPATGYADKCSGSTLSVTVAKTGDQTVALRLADAGAVSGRVTDQHGHPLADVRVHIPGSAADDFVDENYTYGTPTPHLDAYTDADGYYTIRSVTPGQPTVCLDPQYAVGAADFQAQCLGAAPGSTSGGQTVDVTADSTTQHVDVSLTEKPKSANGRPPQRSCAAALTTARGSAHDRARAARRLTQQRVRPPAGSWSGCR